MIGYETTLYRGAKGTVEIARLGPGIVLSTMSGHDTGDLTPHNLAAFSNEIGQFGSLCVFIDARQLRGTATEAREAGTAFLKAHRGPVRAIHLLTNSKLIDMAVAVFNLVMGGPIRSHSDVNSFERAIAREVPGFTHLRAPSKERPPSVPMSHEPMTPSKVNSKQSDRDGSS